MESGPNSPPATHGFDSEGEFVEASGEFPGSVPRQPRQRHPSTSGARTRRGFAATGEEFVPIQLEQSRRKKSFRKRSGTDPLASVPENAELPKAPSLEWDGYEEDESLEVVRPLESTRAWSTNTLFSNPAHQESSSGEEDFLSPTAVISPPASGGVFEALEPLPAVRMDTAMLKKKVERAMLEAEEDVLPFMGKPVTLACLTRLCTVASSLKKDLQAAHVELSGDKDYLDSTAAAAAECRKKLTLFLVQAEADRVQLEVEEKDRQAQATANKGAASAAAKQPIIAKRISAAVEELVAVQLNLETLILTEPKGDEEVFEKVEQQRVLDERFAAAVMDGKEAARLGLENELLNEAAQLEEKMSACKKAKVAAGEKLIQWRRSAGVWAEKKKRSTARTDLKLPTFSPSLAGQATIYDFEKDWQEYKVAMDFSKEESLRTLKLAIQQPTRNEVDSFSSEEEVFSYLQKHYGNPMVLLNAREQEVRKWSQCCGSDMEKREWLIQAKSKLEATVKLCHTHNIERYLHFSSIAGEIQSKFPPDLTKDFKAILKKHLSPAGVLEKEKIVGLLLEFMEDKILDCTLGVNLDIVNYLGASKTQDVETDLNRQQQGGARQRGGKMFQNRAAEWWRPERRWSWQQWTGCGQQVCQL
jgi:hypothetical protein